MTIETDTDHPSLLNYARLVAFICWLPYCLSIVFPESWWAFHFIAFIAPVYKYSLLLISLFLILFGHRFINIIKLQEWFISTPNRKSWLVIGLTLMAGLMFYSFPMHESFYGDSEVFGEKMGEKTTTFDVKYLNNLLTPDVSSPKSGNRTVLSAVRLLSYYFDTSHDQVYRVMDAICGMLYVFIWVWFVIKYFDSHILKWFFLIAGLLAPFIQFFFGYKEIYAPAIPTLFGYFMAVTFYIKYRRKELIGLIALLLFLSLKFHSSSFMLIPSFLLVLVLHMEKNRSLAKSLINWKNVVLFLMLPVILLGGIVYFFVLQDYNDLRFVNENVDIYTRMFLPILSPPPPLDRYTLFSFHHFFDYFNLLFLWSGAMLFVIVTVVWKLPHKIDWSHPSLIIFGTTLALYAFLFFMINPLMSMPIDCDYFSLPAAAFFFFAIALATQQNVIAHFETLLAPGIGVALLCIPIFISNYSQSSLSQRMEHVGVYVFKTYWIRSAGDISAGIALEADTDRYEARYLSVLEQLRPHANESNDKEYANLLWRLAKYYRKTVKDYEKARLYHLEAFKYDPDLVANYIGLMESNYYLNQYEDAYKYSLKLVKYQYPNERQALRIAIECSMLAGFYQTTINHCNEYLQIWNDEDIRIIRDDLITQFSQGK